MDVFEDLFFVGSTGRRRWVLAFVILGRVLGGRCGYHSADIIDTTQVRATMGGVLFGVVIAILLRGCLIFLGIFLVILAATVGWQWLVGA